MRRVSAFILLALCLVLAAPATIALGHAELTSASPGPGDTIEVVPEELVARFSQDLRDDRTSLELRDSEGTALTQGGKDPEQPRVQRMALPDLVPGRYEVRWVSYSAEDDELARDSYQFEVAEVSAVAAAESAEPIDSSADPVAALPWFEPGQDDPAVGLLAPPVTGASFDGTPVSIEANGRAKMLVFLAHWCPHCQEEVPEVQRWLDEDGLPETIDLISVATAIDETRPNYPPDAWLEREGWNAPVIVDGDGQVAQQYGLSAFPFWVIVDTDGRVVGRTTGRLPVEQLDQIVTWLAEQELDTTEREGVGG